MPGPGVRRRATLREAGDGPRGRALWASGRRRCPKVPKLARVGGVVASAGSRVRSKSQTVENMEVLWIVRWFFACFPRVNRWPRFHGRENTQRSCREEVPVQACREVIESGPVLIPEDDGVDVVGDQFGVSTMFGGVAGRASLAFLCSGPMRALPVDSSLLRSTQFSHSSPRARLSVWVTSEKSACRWALDRKMVLMRRLRVFL